MKSLEDRILGPTDRLLDTVAAEIRGRESTSQARLAILEAASSKTGGWDLEEYWRATGSERPRLAADPLKPAEDVISSISLTEIPIPLALSSLSREKLVKTKQRKTGAYYTDWRLAENLAQAAVPKIKFHGPWIDAACGSGILLTAAVMQLPLVEDRNEVIRKWLCGADLSEFALRGACLSVASLTDDLSAVSAFSQRLLLQDSLRSQEAWKKLAPTGASLVLGNPPWEKLKITRHEVSISAGDHRKYGQQFHDSVDIRQGREELLTYIEAVASGTRLQGKGEHDLYKLFLELGLGLAASGGVIGFLLPAGIIRSKGTEDLRREILELLDECSITVLENREKHFAIDSRFKFLSIVGVAGQGESKPIALKVADRAGAVPRKAVSIDRAALAMIRPDLSIPEVRTEREWDLYRRLAANSVTIGDSNGPWRPEYRREVDMTRDQRIFRRERDTGTLPLLEGRHVGQFRWRAKRYISGEGRSAKWMPQKLSSSILESQWHVLRNDLNVSTRLRTERSRLGFCDITGQTNERSLHVARIPAGVVCGNKVPTLIFKDDSVDREDLFLALANSFVVDWMMRRTVTTSVNFFLLDTLPLPKIPLDGKVGKELVLLTRKITSAEGDARIDPWIVGLWRARSDALIAHSWGIDLRDLELVLGDFPLIDRGQPTIQGEAESTVTNDCVLGELADILGAKHESKIRRFAHRAVGAVPYVPAELQKWS